MANCGSSWIGFWRINDRHEAWLRVADCFADNASSCNNLAAMLPDGDLKTWAIAERDHLNKSFVWAFNRSKKCRFSPCSLYSLYHS